MRRLAYILVVLAIIAPLGCATDGEIKFKGQKPEADEPSYIKDPEATANTHDSGNKKATTRTDSNRVDIPVYEFAQLVVHYSGGARTSNQKLDARYGGQQLEAGRFTNGFDTRNAIEWLNSRQSSEFSEARANRSLYHGLESKEELSRRMARDKITAYSSDSVSYFEQGRDKTSRMASNERLNAMSGSDKLEAARSREGFFQASGERIIGLHLYKYANREMVGDGVEVVYTLVYYNANEYDTGPTEIDEPVPFYTNFVTGSATLPKPGTSVNFIARPGDRDLLRWSFPQGIKAGETGEMKYRVKVDLNAPYDNRPAEDQPKSR